MEEITSSLWSADLRVFEEKSQQIIKTLVDHFGGPNKTTVLPYLVGEVVDNIKQHSHADRASFTFAPVRQEFSIEDNGIGIGASFRAAGRKTDDQQALELAVQGASTKPGARGYGLPTIVRLIGALGGAVEIRSGQAALRIESGEQLSLVGKQVGTKITVSLPNQLAIDHKAFYAIVEGKS